MQDASQGENLYTRNQIALQSDHLNPYNIMTENILVFHCATVQTNHVNKNNDWYHFPLRQMSQKPSKQKYLKPLTYSQTPATWNITMKSPYYLLFEF